MTDRALEASGQAGRLARWAGLDADAWLAEVNHCASALAIRTATGQPLRFVFDPADAPKLPALAYEGRIHDQGLVGCRRDGRGRDHDRWNAAIWLTFPRTKAMLNRLHVEDAAGPGPLPAVVGQRSRVRDLATLVDESGLAWVSRDPESDALLAKRRWRDLLHGGRARLLAAVRPCVIGHGLLGKLLRPYPGLTANTLVVPVCERETETACRVALGPGWDGADELAADPADALIAARLAAVAVELAGVEGGSARRAGFLLPLPVLGLPGFCDANREPAFYDDSRVFRPLPAMVASTN